jgi:hypothetical protein
MSPPSAVTEMTPRAVHEAAPTLPRLLAGLPPEGALTLAEHLSVHGAPPVAHASERRC